MADAARVFISYSGKDTDIVDRLKAALAAAGVAVWLDHEQLTPGTPNWQVAVREGIAQATVVVYVASETAAISPYVIDEISLARGKGKPVIPFWARGSEWHDCAPLGWGLTQYTDGRAAAYDAGLAKLLRSLGAADTMPAPTPQPALPAPQPAPMSATPAASIAPRRAPTPTQRSFSPPNVPARLASLGFRGLNPNGTPAILPPLVSVAGGSFLMGSAESDKEASKLEKPQYRVGLAAFKIGKYPVTVAEYALAVRAGIVPEPPEVGGVTWQAQLRRIDHPVICVSWQDATTYVAWLRGVTGEAGWRLPSEAQWEKAARWDTARRVSHIYPWGDTFDKNRCNTRESGIKTTTPVGSYPARPAGRSGASPCGAEDMAGNVWEWTSSLRMPYPYSESDGREDQRYTVNRILRGGSWDDLARGARAAYRDVGRWDVLNNDVWGFRLALARRAGVTAGG